MGEFELQVALSPFRVGLRSGLQIIPIIFNTVKILKEKHTNYSLEQPEKWKVDLLDYYL